MYSPTRAILWQIFRRNRWGFAAACAYLLLAIATSHLLTPYVRSHWGDAGVDFVGLYLGAPCAIIMVLVIAAFCLTGSRAGETTPPTYMLVLPVSTRTLVTVPMVAGAITVVAVWLVIACLVLRPAEISAPLWWPAAVLVVFLTIFQAIAWTPFTQKWMQAILTIAAGAGTFGWVLGGIAFDFARFDSTAEPFFMTGTGAVLIPLAYAAALSGVRMTRRGDVYEWKQWSRLMDAIAVWRKPAEHPFSSASAAQVWFECRSCGWYPPLFTAAMTLFLLPVVLLDDTADVEKSWKFLEIFIGLPLLLATVSSAALGNVDGLSSNSRQGSFLFVRPMSSAALVRDKMLMAMLSTAVIWLAVLPLGMLIFLRPSFFTAVMDVARSISAWKLLVGLPLAAMLILAFTWKQLIEGMWIPLTGRGWLINLFGFGLVGLIFFSLGFGLWINFYPEYQARLVAAVPWLLLVALALKLLVAIIVLRALLRSQLFPIEFSLAMLGAWCLVVAGLSAVVFRAVPAGIAPVSQIVSGIVLLIPFSRLMAAPLALEWNRHR